jgi:hypothetical protein
MLYEAFGFPVTSPLSFFFCTGYLVDDVKVQRSVLIL